MKLEKVWGASAALGLTIAALLALSACSDPASQPARPEALAAGDVASPAAATEDRRDYASREDDARGGARGEVPEVDPRDAPPPMRDGRPLWSATRRLTSEENAERAFRSHGAEFGSRDVDAYIAAAHAFLKNPPSDVQTLKRRNGDTLYYAASDNVFAVAREDGAPRTLFKPEEGAAYWREQQEREAERASRGSSRGDDDRG